MPKRKVKLNTAWLNKTPAQKRKALRGGTSTKAFGHIRGKKRG